VIEMIYKHLDKYEKERKKYQSTHNECWKCYSKNLVKIDSGEDVSKCKECGSTNKFFTYNGWLKYIKSSNKNDIKRNKQHIRDLKCTLKADKLKRDMEFKETVKELNQNIRWAKENLKAVK
jgi:hypothetical protein